ncbi:MAG: calcium/sodium antiporter [Bacteroidetes bacterium]|nr:calcium/sodium antiporter [Bacteroidota bacterium]MDA1120215.1 calcium/sodium antiporter [Bacteroidota bacterium]
MTLFDSALLNIFFNVLILVFAIGLLWKGADELVESASRIAATFGVSDLVIGLTVVAFGTSAPEFAVTLNASFNGQPDISVGNIVGSNIFNLGFILGSVAIIKTIHATRKLVYRDGIFMILVTFLLLAIFYDLKLERWEGICLFSLLLGYLAFLFINKEPIDNDDLHSISATWKDAIILPVTIGVVVLGGHLLVESASFLARTAGISEWVIAVTIVAAGTSAPEMATSLSAVLKGRHGMSAGNLIGSDLFNILGVLGVAGMVNPLPVNPEALGSLAMLSGMVILVVIFLRTGWKLTRIEGIILFTIGLARWIFDFMK